VVADKYNKDDCKSLQARPRAVHVV
jgi:hypothetical protein